MVGRLPLFFECAHARLADGGAQAFIVLDGLDLFFDIAAQHDIGAAPRHIGGDGDGVFAPSLGNDVGFAVVLLGVEDFVPQAFFLQQARNQLGVLNRAGAHQHGLAFFVAGFDVGNGSLIALDRGFVDTVLLVVAQRGLVGRDDDGF